MGSKRGANKVAQAAMEYFLVIMFVFLMVIPLVIYFFNESQSASDEVSAAQLNQIARKIVANAEKVYAFGEPTTFTLDVYMPTDVTDISLSDDKMEITFNRDGGTSTITKFFPMNVTGNVSNHPGLHKIRIQAAGGLVSITDIS